MARENNMSTSDSFPSSEFDKWSETYDLSVNNDLFPFTGYKILLEIMTSLASIKPGLRVLDLGTGTGNLALPFASSGCDVWCTDFSASMLKKAQQKIPSAHFVLNDLRGELPLELIRPFDRIVSAYVFHHFTLDQKITILGNLRTILAPGGRIIIGDISYPSEDMMETSKLEEGDNWEDEFYWLATKAIPALETLGFKVDYEQVSPCAGIYVLFR
jgi:putative AdoMet-dependent methyltransferase